MAGDVELDEDLIDGAAVAWRDLVQSQGWSLAKALADDLHGPTAQVQQIDKALSNIGRGDREAAEDTVIQIRARARAVEQFIAAVEERARLTQKKETKPRPFEQFRRIYR